MVGELIDAYDAAVLNGDGRAALDALLDGLRRDADYQKEYDTYLRRNTQAIADLVLAARRRTNRVSANHAPYARVGQ